MRWNQLNFIVTLLQALRQHAPFSHNGYSTPQQYPCQKSSAVCLPSYSHVLGVPERTPRRPVCTSSKYTAFSSPAVLASVSFMLGVKWLLTATRTAVSPSSMQRSPSLPQ